GIGLWKAWSRCFAGAVQVRRGELENGLERLRSEFAQRPETRQLPRYMVLLGELALALAAHGEWDESKTTIEEALMRAERRGACPDRRTGIRALTIAMPAFLSLDRVQDTREQLGVGRSVWRTWFLNPPPGTREPQAFLIEYGPGFVLQTHFHDVDEYQVVV